MEALRLRKLAIEKKLLDWKPNQVDVDLFTLFGLNEEDALAMQREHHRMRVLASNSGCFIQDAIGICLSSVEGVQPRFRVPNPSKGRPASFEYDFRIGDEVLEIKLRETTTDGDHFFKEEAKLRCCVDMGFSPVRLVMYDCGSSSQRKMSSVYERVGGRFFCGQSAWDEVKIRSGVDLQRILFGSR